ncbi:phage tail protein [Streptomyces cinereoruber]|uniref:phage tail protein n=1 Tax=Streptomyces cinereoruber TaxID=67260 RepID=UPI00365BBE5F
MKLPSKILTNPMSRGSAVPNILGMALDPRQQGRPGAYPQVGMAMRFHVTLDEWGTDLGLWSSCRGLQVQFTSKEIAEGGQYFDRELLPERIKFSTITLERVMTLKDSPKVQQWLSQVAARWTGYEYDDKSPEYQGQNVTIRLFDHQGRVVSAWVLKNAVPKEWTGPDLNAQSNTVATEKISFEHSGFLK